MPGLKKKSSKVKYINFREFHRLIYYPHASDRNNMKQVNPWPRSCTQKKIELKNGVKVICGCGFRNRVTWKPRAGNIFSTPTFPINIELVWYRPMTINGTEPNIAKEIPSSQVRPRIASMVGRKNKIKVTPASELYQSYTLTHQVSKLKWGVKDRKFGICGHSFWL